MESLVSLEKSRYTVEDIDNCNACRVKPGFPTLCKTGDSVEHRFCLDCVFSVYKQPGSQLLCPACNEPFNFQDYLVVRELHLIYLCSDKSISDYFRNMQWEKIPYPNPKELCMEDFLWLGEKDQKKIISKMYWGNSFLFDGIDDYPINNAKDKVVKEKLLEMLGNLWSPALGRKEKNQRLLEFLTNGLFVQSCQNETKETFLHRCHLFLRAFLPLHDEFNASLVNRIQGLTESFPEYNNLQLMEDKDLDIIERPAIGPLNVEEPDVKFTYSPSNQIFNLNLLQLVLTLKKALKNLFLLCTGTFSLLTIACYIAGFGFNKAMMVMLMPSVFLTIAFICSFLYCKYSTDSIDKKIDFVSYDEKLGIYQLVVAVTVGIISLILAPRAREVATRVRDAGIRFYLLMSKVRG